MTWGGNKNDYLAKSAGIVTPVETRYESIPTGVQGICNYAKNWIPVRVYPDENRGWNDRKNIFRLFTNSSNHH
jgi:hypothetical protein